MKKLLLAMLLMAAPVAADPRDLATTTSSHLLVRGIEPPKTLTISGPGGPVAEISFETGEASYSVDLGTATRIFWDAIEAGEHRRRDIDTGFFHDGARWRLVWRGRIIW